MNRHISEDRNFDTDLFSLGILTMNLRFTEKMKRARTALQNRLLFFLLLTSFMSVIISFICNFIPTHSANPRIELKH
jgi:hypothetical protein